MNNYPESADIETSTDNYAKRFSGEVGDFFLETQLNQALNIIGKYDSPSVLDVGGGHAQLAIPLVKRGFDVTVTGSDDSCETRLKRNLDDGSYRYKTCDMLHLPYEDSSFDIVMAFRLLPHVERWDELIKELARVARKSVIVDYPDIRSTNILNSLLFSVKKNMEGNTRPFLLFNRKQIVDQFGKNSCMLESFQPAFTMPMVLHRKIGSAQFSKFMEQLCKKTGMTSLFGSPIVAHFQKSGK